jgi:FkbM family methyltransferase
MAMLKRAAKSALRSIGYEIRALKHTCDLDLFFGLLDRLRFKASHIVDVGANQGNWTRTAVRYFPQALYTLVEPQQHLRASVQDLEASHQIRWVNAGCADAPGFLPLAVAERDYSSSTFVRVNWAKRTIRVEVKTLDQVVADEPVPELVKIDAEGYDIKVIDGAKTLLGKTDVFLIEAMICGPFENTTQAVINRMAQAGYSILDITDLNRSLKTGSLYLVELAFARNGSALLEQCRSGYQ